MRRIALVIVAVVALLLVASQLALPPLAERAARGRLTKEGGSADVSIAAFPAPRLLFGHGDSLEVEDSGIRLPEKPTTGSFDRLDKFEEVRIHLRDMDAGPLVVRSFNLDRPPGADAYSTRITARTTPRAVAGFLGGGLGELATGLTLGRAGSVEFPLDVRATVTSRDGRREVSAVQGAVAGIPAGPLVELVLDAVVRRL